MTDQPNTTVPPAEQALPPSQPCTDPRHTGALREQLGCTAEEATANATANAATAGITADAFTEAAVSRSALLAAITAIEALPQDFECDPGRGDAVKLLRRLADHYVTAEQPAGLSWEARAEHAVRLYAVTAIERDDARTEAAKLREQLAELERRTAEQHDNVAFNNGDTVAAVRDALLDTEQHTPATALAAAHVLLAAHTRHLAEQAQPTDGTERPEDTARRFARRLRAVEQLCSGRPGYHTITVKQLLGAMGDADDGPEPVSDDELTRRVSTAIGQYLDDADADAIDTDDLAENVVRVIAEAGR